MLDGNTFESNGTVERYRSDRPPQGNNRRDNSLFHTFFDQSCQLTWLLDLDGTLLEVNPSALDFGQVEARQVVGHLLANVKGWTFSNKEKSHLRAAISTAATGEVVCYDTKVKGFSNLWTTLALTVRPVADEFLAGSTASVPYQVIVEGVDVSDRQQLESRLLRAQRLESVGALKLGIVHDLKNLLALTTMTAHLLQAKFSTPDDRQQKLFEMLQSSIKRADILVKEMFSFACGNEQNHDLLNVKKIVQDIQRIIQPTFSNSIMIETVVTPNLWPIHGNENQIYQVLLNLCLNARDAMPKGGYLRLSAENMEAYQPEQPISVEGTSQEIAQDFVVITVADTGLGIPAQLIDKIFEPFFTTKPRDMGTGLGLSTSLDIIKNHGGFIDVLSSQKIGTQFRVVLPTSVA